MLQIRCGPIPKRLNFQFTHTRMDTSELALVSQTDLVREGLGNSDASSPFPAQTARPRALWNTLFSPNSCFLPGILNVTNVHPEIFFLFRVAIAPHTLVLAPVNIKKKEKISWRCGFFGTPCVRGTCVWKGQFRQCVKSGGMQRSFITPCEEDWL